MGLHDAYRLRKWRRRRALRGFLHGRRLRLVQDRLDRIGGSDILLFATLRNEKIRLPYFLDYYRRLGVDHFLIVDNGSTDGAADYLAEQGDVTVWYTEDSYREAAFGMDWINHLLRHHGHGHWVLVVDPDEFLVYPFCDTRPLSALTSWLDTSEIRSFGTMLLDMYPKGPPEAQPYREGQDPLEIAAWFDSGNYTIRRNETFGNLWIQGGPRMRSFFRETPERAPALNKIPLVRWHKSYVYESSTHMLLPRGLNLVYDPWGGEKASGVLLHTKFLHTFAAKAAEEVLRAEHYQAGREYHAYDADPDAVAQLWCKWSEKYINWRQLEVLGLLSKGNWA
nr:MULTISPECIES: glycosyltransferase family 2 protein [Pseudooceanicola]